MIIAAAILQDGVIYTLAPPRRHHDIISWMKICVENGGLGIGYQQNADNQGFLDHRLGFVGRYHAARIAKMCNQIEKTKFGKELYSEDLW